VGQLEHPQGPDRARVQHARGIPVGGVHPGGGQVVDQLDARQGRSELGRVELVEIRGQEVDPVGQALDPPDVGGRPHERAGLAADAGEPLQQVGADEPGRTRDEDAPSRQRLLGGLQPGQRDARIVIGRCMHCSVLTG
jgi:hypothetical protein